jgi:peptidoglycan L-alanyl-D-glutamate endopeptidase CwlK
MTYRLASRSRRNLEGVHPDLVRVVERAIEITRVDFAVIEGLRSIERQRELVARGSSRTLDSRHLMQPDGYGHAVDVMAVGDLDGDGDVDAQDRSRAWDRDWYYLISVAMERAALELGVEIRWGGRFKGFFDGPHFELDPVAALASGPDQLPHGTAVPEAGGSVRA